MNITMNRDQFIAFLQGYYIDKKVNIEEALNLISEYCIEHHKSEDSVKKLIEFLTKDASIINAFLINPINYYECKFIIYKLEAPNKYEDLLNANIIDDKNVILIF